MCSAVIYINLYDTTTYHDRIYPLDDLEGLIGLDWCGQKRGRQDKIVLNVEGDHVSVNRDVAVAIRRNKTEPFTIYGILDSTYGEIISFGDHDNGVPSKFKLRIRLLRHPLRCEPNVDDKELNRLYYKQAVFRELGFNGKASMSGIQSS